MLKNKGTAHGGKSVNAIKFRSGMELKKPCCKLFKLVVG